MFVNTIICLRASSIACRKPDAVAPASPDAAADEIAQTSESGPVKATVTLSPKKPQLGDSLNLTLTSPSGQSVQLVGATGSCNTFTPLATWDILFTPCTAAFDPDTVDIDTGNVTVTGSGSQPDDSTATVDFTIEAEIISC